jgi:hypothetical protein
MRKCSRSVFLTVILGLLVCAAAYAQNYPSVQFVSFDSGTFAYTYRVTQTVNPAKAIRTFEVNAYLLTGLSSQMSYPVANFWGGSTNWGIRSVSSWPDGQGNNYATYRWQKTVNMPNPLPQTWIADFVVTVPGTHPKAGNTYVQFTDYSKQEYALSVPSLVPEPGSMAAFGGMLLGLGPMILRARKR